VKASKVVFLVFLSILSIFAVNIQLVKSQSSGTIYIRSDGSVDPATAPVRRVGDVYTLTGNIDGSIVVERDNIVVDGAGYTLQGSETGIRPWWTKNITIKNMIINACSWGIDLSDSSNNKVYGNNITNCGYGIEIRVLSNSNIISGNTVTNNDVGISIDLTSNNNILRNNSMINNNYNFNVDAGCVNDVDTSNTVDGKPIYYWVNQQNKTIPSDAGYVALVNCTNITVKNLSLAKEVQGILLSHTTNSIIAKNNLTNCDYGVLLHNSSHNTINENNIKNIRRYGVELKEDSNSNRIFGNHIETGIGTGIDFFGALNNRIVGNNITNNNVGIFVSGSPNNIIHHNNFINNTKQVNDVYYVLFFGSPTVNIWDNGSEGNYWSDYTGQDANGDGIGDTAYNIYEKNQDNYPLMSPVVISDFPDEENESIPTPEPFPTTWIVAATAIIAIAVIITLGTVIYRRKRSTSRKTQ
jgi:parallel beta-helix repeat protein